MATFKKVASTFPINAPVEWIDSASDTVQIGLVAGYSTNSVDEICVEVRPTSVKALGDLTTVRALNPNNRMVQLTHAVTGDRLW